ncbi:MAG: type II toxin-antitoxin system PemK/MazF family toxin [Armatimonadetes bacterium]|nr:type II toxin-antitoxin system PemK/MazF family toxin [Armatimonadota bacterium]
MTQGRRYPAVPVPQRGDTYYLDFSPATGVEMKGDHPALVIQNDVANKVSGVTIVAAITSTLKVAELPVGVLIEPSDSGLPHRSVVHLGHIYTVDRNRLQRHIGRLSSSTMEKVEDAIRVSLGLAAFRMRQGE